MRTDRGLRLCCSVQDLPLGQQASGWCLGWTCVSLTGSSSSMAGSRLACGPHEFSPQWQQLEQCWAFARGSLERGGGFGAFSSAARQKPMVRRRPTFSFSRLGRSLPCSSLDRMGQGRSRSAQDQPAATRSYRSMPPLATSRPLRRTVRGPAPPRKAASDFGACRLPPSPGWLPALLLFSGRPSGRSFPATACEPSAEVST